MPIPEVNGQKDLFTDKMNNADIYLKMNRLQCLYDQ